jgi:hypothetical protein
LLGDFSGRYRTRVRAEQAKRKKAPSGCPQDIRHLIIEVIRPVWSGKIIKIIDWAEVKRV